MMREQESQRHTAGHFLEAAKTCFKASSTGRSTHHPQGSHEHRPPVQTLALGLCEGQEILHSHEIIFLPYCFSFPKRKEKLVSTHGCVLRCGHPSEISAWGGLHGEAMLLCRVEEQSHPHTCLSLHLGKLCIFQQDQVVHIVENEWVHPGKLALKTKLENQPAGGKTHS